MAANRNRQEETGMTPEEEIKTLSQNLETLFNSIDEMVFILDMQGHILMVNDTVKKRLLYSPGELTGMDVLMLHVPERRDEALRVVEGMVDGTIDSCPVPILAKDGTRIEVETKITRGWWNRKEVLVGVSRDITERKRSEEALRRQSVTLSILNEIISRANKANDLPGLFTSILEESLRLLDFDAGGIYLVNRSTKTADVVLSKNLPPAFLDEIRTIPIEKSPYDTLFIKSEPIFSDNYDTIAPEQAKLSGFLSLASVPLLSKGVTVGVLNIASLRRHIISEDEKLALISIGWELGSSIERMAAEDEVKKTSENLETLFNSIDEMVFVLDMQGKIVTVNDAVSKRLMYTPGELTGMDVLLLHVPERRAEALINIQGMIAGTIDSCPVPVLTKGDTRIEVETKVTRGWWNNQEVLIGVSRDVTERRKVEEALKEKTGELDQYFSTSLDLFCIADTDGYFRRLNPEWQTALGYSLADLEGSRFLDFVHPDDLPGTLAAIADLDYKKSVLNFTNRYRHKDGSYRWIEWRSFPSPDSNLIFAAARDITERKQVEEDLLQTTDRLWLATRAGGVGIWDYDVVNNRLTWDDEMFALYGITADQFAGAYEAWQAGLHPEDRERGDEEIQKALRGEKEFDTEFRVLWPDGSTHNVRALALVQRDAAGKPLRMIGTNWDITAQKNAETEITRQAGLIRSLLDSIPDIIFFKDTEGFYLGCNPPFAEFVGKSQGEIIGKTDYELFDKEIADFFRDNDKHMLELGEPRHNEEWITYPDGRKILIDTLKTPYWGPERKLIGVLGISRDITERRRAEDAVIEANKKLNILNGITRHDVLNQITALVMLLEIVEESVQDADTLDFIRKAEGATERITRQIEFTREYQDIGVLAPQWQNVSDLINRAKEQLTTCPYELRVDIGAVEIYADPLLPKVFYNLLENAVRHGENVSIVRFFGQESEKGLSLVCEDNGAGVDAASKKHLFKRGFGKHTGFGLYLMREILSITGISIAETGEHGKGARFEMVVPKGGYRFTMTE